MNSNTIIGYVTQLTAQIPTLLVYVTGLIFALVYWRRCPVPSALVFAGTVMLLVVALLQPLLTQYLVQARAELSWPAQTLGWVLSAVTLGSSVLRAVALGLILTAVFFGRGPCQAGQKPYKTSGVTPAGTPG
jgi:hypothetical protein